jgi:hypothetical protein
MANFAAQAKALSSKSCYAAGMKLIALLALILAPLFHQERPAYAAGQVWEYRTRPQEPESLLKIQRVEADPAGRPIYHISLIGLHIAGLKGGEAQHLPVSKATLDASVTRLSASTAAFPDPSEGIALWRQAKGGVFTIPVAEIVGVIEQSAQKPAE